MEKIRYKIGEFSKLARVTVRTLRHYEEIGLLKPDVVDMWTGYRYYSPGQLQKLLFIIQLKDMGFTLSEIADLYCEDSHYPSMHAIEDKILDCERQLESLRQRHAQLQDILSEQKKIERMEKIYFDTLPAIIVASNKTILENYDALGVHLCTVVGPEMARLSCECPEPGYCFTVETAKEYKAENFEIEYCEKVTRMGQDSDIIKFKELPEVPEAICMKAYGPYSRLREYYLELFAEITKRGYEITDSPRACYVDGIWNQEDPQKWLTIIQVPVKRI